MRYLILLLLIAGCSTPRERLEQFESRYSLDPVAIEYNWLPYSILPHVDGDKIIVNRTALADYKVCEAEVTKHERGHIAGLDHCKDKNCLMHYKLHYWHIHLWDKRLCRTCDWILKQIRADKSIIKIYLTTEQKPNTIEQ